MGSRVRPVGEDRSTTQTWRLRSVGSMLALAGAFTTNLAAPQSSASVALTSVPAKVWAQQAAEKEIQIIEHNGSFIRYRQRSVDSRRDELRDVIESKDGTVARLLMRDNRPLTTEEDQAERDRLNRSKSTRLNSSH